MKIVKYAYRIFCLIFFDPYQVLLKWRGIPHYVRNFMKYQNLVQNEKISIGYRDISPMLSDRYENAGTASGHYFFMDLWAAQKIYNAHSAFHVDVGSRIDGFVAHILPHCRVEYVDIRSIKSPEENLTYIQGSITNLPYPDNSILSLSSLHVIEHIGLGRYGDEVDPLGYRKAMRELERVLRHGGRLLVAVPVGKERVCFDAHRIFHPETIIKAFDKLKLQEFSLIDDAGDSIISHASIDSASQCIYGCGLFEFIKEEQ
jgi:SAM-dependent methyltransferase